MTTENTEGKTDETRTGPATGYPSHCAKCAKCKYHILEDNGYSNYTVEGTDIDCLKGLNPKFPVDAWYGECPEGEFASKCSSFVEGEGVSVDVEHEDGALENYSSDPEIKELLRRRDAPDNNEADSRPAKGSRHE